MIYTAASLRYSANPMDYKKVILDRTLDPGSKLSFNKHLLIERYLVYNNICVQQALATAEILSLSATFCHYLLVATTWLCRSSALLPFG